VQATVTLDLVDGAPTVTLRADVSGRVPGLDQMGFTTRPRRRQELPISRALGSVDIHVTATLE